METGVFPRDDVQDFFRHYFIPVKFSSGTDSEQFYRYGITGVPSYVILDTEGNEVFRDRGYCEPALFLEKLEKARRDALSKKT